MSKTKYFLISFLVLTFVFCLPVCIQTAASQNSGEDFIIKVLDAGYGDAILLIPPDASPVLIDCGSAERGPVLAQTLHGYQIGHLEALIVTHPHANHFGGAFDLLEQFSCGKFYYNGDDTLAEPGFDLLLAQIDKRGIPVQVLHRQDVLPLNSKDLSLTVLHPQRLTPSANANSMALLLQYKEIRVLLTADIQPAQQKELLRVFPSLEQTAAVQIPHHGGLLDEQFVRFLNDKIVFMSTGPNEYQKPLEEEIEKISGRIYRTDRHGVITLTTNGHEINVSTENE